MIGPYELNQVHNQDNLAAMAEMPAKSVKFCLTSPPYDALRVYDGQPVDGFDFVATAKELARLMADDGVINWIVADQVVDGSETGNSLRQALHFRDVLGFKMNTIYFVKTNPTPNKPRKSLTPQVEYWFTFYRETPQAISWLQEPSKFAGKSTNGSNGRTDGWTKAKNRVIKDMKRAGNFRQYTVGKDDTGPHPAPFPLALAIDAIYMFGQEAPFIFDPFMGSGTTAVASEYVGLPWLGFDTGEMYCQWTNKRVDKFRMMGLVPDHKKPGDVPRAQLSISRR